MPFRQCKILCLKFILMLLSERIKKENLVGWCNLRVILFFLKRIFTWNYWWTERKKNSRTLKIDHQRKDVQKKTTKKMENVISYWKAYSRHRKFRMLTFKWQLIALNHFFKKSGIFEVYHTFETNGIKLQKAVYGHCGRGSK